MVEGGASMRRRAAPGGGRGPAAPNVIFGPLRLHKPLCRSNILHPEGGLGPNVGPIWVIDAGPCQSEDC
jgi:hypothetical protein